MMSARFRRHTKGLRNHFAAKGYSRKAAKLDFILRFSASNLRHISGNFRRKTTTLYKKVAKSFRNKRVISQHFAKCFLQLRVIAMAVNSSFQLRIAHRLKHWIADFLSFEMVYRMHQLDFRKCSKSG
uniref:Uncharacterized protein n=1 Tax=Vitis vinifera TaxID=29760 RepID=A5B1N1_VITVI|nr:hypothetical protein VITISV_032156 [Vitis vinifera]